MPSHAISRNNVELLLKFYLLVSKFSSEWGGAIQIVEATYNKYAFLETCCSKEIWNQRSFCFLQTYLFERYGEFKAWTEVIFLKFST